MKNVKKIIDKYDVISFDVFDTLICRKVKNPQEIFYLVGYEVLGNEEAAEKFKNDRIKAEKKAREILFYKEVDFADIYSFFDEGKYNLNKLMKSEIDCEIRMAFPNDKIIEFYEYAKLQEKTIFLISDMYLTKDVIENMLKKCNIKDYNKLYVSCEYNCNKLTGKLFEKVAAENGIKLNQMVHFGDSIKADYLGAKKVGLHCYITPQKNRFVRLLGRIK